MNRRFRGLPLLILPTLLAGCDLGGPTADGDVLAVAYRNELTVDQAAQLLLSQDQFPAEDAEVVLAVAELWVDYTLLAFAALEDPDLNNVNLEPILDERGQQQLVLELREQVITVDTALSEADVLAAYERDLPGAEIQASHILLTFPDQATDAERDSVMALAQELKSRAESGEDFAELADEYSRDPGSAGKGGDLGSFRRGTMVRPFEDAAFTADVGEIVGPVETPFGIHVITVTGRTLIPLDSIYEPYRQQLMTQMVVSAESAYIAGVMEPANVQPVEDAYEITRELARNPGTELRGRAGSRPVVEFEGGAVTAGELQTFLQGRTPADRRGIAGLPDSQLEGLLTNLARGQILVERAREAGLEIDAVAADSVENDMRVALRQAAEALGLRNIEVGEDETPNGAVARAVRSTLTGILRGEVNVVPLGPISFSLRSEYGAAINEDAVDPVIEKVMSGEMSAPATSPDATGSGAPTTADPDTSDRDSN